MTPKLLANKSPKSKYLPKGSMCCKISKTNPKNVANSSNLKFDLKKFWAAKYHNIVNEKYIIKCNNLSISNNWNLWDPKSGKGTHERIIRNKV